MVYYIINLSWNFNFTSRTPENGQKCRFLKNGKLLFLTKIGAFSGKMWSETMYHDVFGLHTLNPHGSSHFWKKKFKSWKNGPFWAKLRRVKMAWTFFLNFPQFFHLKKWCKITFKKKSFLTLARARAGQGVKLPFFSKKCIFRAEKGIFSKSSFYT